MSLSQIQTCFKSFGRERWQFLHFMTMLLKDLQSRFWCHLLKRVMVSVNNAQSGSLGSTLTNLVEMSELPFCCSSPSYSCSCSCLLSLLGMDGVDSGSSNCCLPFNSAANWAVASYLTTHPSCSPLVNSCSNARIQPMQSKPIRYQQTL